MLVVALVAYIGLRVVDLLRERTALQRIGLEQQAAEAERKAEVALRGWETALNVADSLRTEASSAVVRADSAESRANRHAAVASDLRRRLRGTEERLAADSSAADSLVTLVQVVKEQAAVIEEHEAEIVDLRVAFADQMRATALLQARADSLERVATEGQKSLSDVTIAVGVARAKAGRNAATAAVSTAVAIVELIVLVAR